MLITIHGLPKPQGSKSGFIRGGRVVLVEASKDLPQWRAKVEAEIRKHVEAQSWTPEPRGAYEVSYRFFLPQAKSNRDIHHVIKPDLDKLIRAINDSATRAGLFRDDCQIVGIIATKEFGEPRLELKIMKRE